MHLWHDSCLLVIEVRDGIELSNKLENNMEFISGAMKRR